MAEEKFKEFKDEDVISVFREKDEELFSPNKAVVKPFSESNNYFIKDVPADSDFPDYYSPVSYLQKSGSNLTYFSFGRALSASYANSTGSGMMYHNVLENVQPLNDKYKIDDGSTSTSTTEMDVISVSREFAKDGLDPEYFGVLIHTGSASETTDPSDFSYSNGVKGLYPSDDEFQTNMGKKRYLYPTEDTVTENLYAESSDDFKVKEGSSNLDLTNPLGEMFEDTGVVLLYVDRLSTTFPNINTANALKYVAGVGGNSVMRLNSKIYFAKLENKEFNYTTNPTFYESSNRNVIKQVFRNDPKVYPTMIGFYNDENELIAVGKLSKPFEKDFQEEAIIRAELSY